MPTYHVHMTRVQSIIIEVDVDTPEAAEAQAWSAVNDDPETIELTDSEYQFDYIESSEGEKYTWNNIQLRWVNIDE